MRHTEQLSKNIVSLSWLEEHLSDEDVVIVDCRFVLGNPKQGLEEYKQDHVPGAVYLGLEQDLSGPKEQHGGRHPLPDLMQLSLRLGEVGISNSKTVVAYDNQSGAMAARLWFLLKYLGHSKVYVLNEGYTKWKERGYPTTAEIPQPIKETYTPNIQPHLLASMEEVKQSLQHKQTVLVDSRSHDRYRGENETIDPVGGHIPGARNEFWMEALEEGAWKSTEEQRKRLEYYLHNEEQKIILYCGSGVTACANMIAFDEVGLKPRLYLGSWSDWISYPGNLIEKT